MIFQEPMTSLNPVLSIGTQLTEGLRRHQGLDWRGAGMQALRMLDAAQISEPKRRMAQYPHELSGGLRQRVMIAMAMACDPAILIADEPTTALDVTIQAQILELMTELQAQTGMGILLITHDMGVVAEMADYVAVMRNGRLVESGEPEAIFRTPREEYTQTLLQAVPRFSSGLRAPKTTTAANGDETSALEVRDLVVRFDVKGGFPRRVVQRVHAVERASFKLARGETLALVGESGCGKSTTAKALMRLLPSSGTISLAGKNVAAMDGRNDLQVRRSMQMVFQDPHASLDPRMTVGDLVGEPLVVHGLAKGGALSATVAGLFERVGLHRTHIDRYPHEFSGGQRQRICIARALSLNPKIIIADECLSALDVSIQAQILSLLRELQADLGLSYLFISHDIAVVEEISHRIAVMYLGQIVETGPTAAVLGSPGHPYTRRLLSAVPVPEPDRTRAARRHVQGEVPSPFRPPDFRPVYVTYRDFGNGHLVAEPLEG
jgi:peptide/nickel transport system ATP-binding protein